MTCKTRRLSDTVQARIPSMVILNALVLEIAAPGIISATEEGHQIGPIDDGARNAWSRILPPLADVDLKSFSTTTEAAKILASTPGASASFGWSTAADGDTIVVGAYRNSLNSGTAFVFERNHGGADNWGEVKKLVASDLADYSYFGQSVSISGDTIVVGADVDDVFPGDLTAISWVCVGTNGGSCTASGSGNIDELVDLPAGASVTFTVDATCDPAAVPGPLSNTATVAPPVSVTERDPSDNTATDSDTIVAEGDVIFIDGFELGDTSAWD